MAVEENYQTEENSQTENFTQTPESWQARSELLLGTDTIKELAKKRVAIIGLGGVGSFAAEMIARGGVENLLIVDSDKVEQTNLNRQLLALHSTVGEYKCEVMESRLKDINSNINITSLNSYLTEENVDQLIGHFEPHYIVDAIDTLSPKVALIRYAVEKGIPIVSAMGAGAKRDATKVKIADLSRSFNCPLAYILRKRLRKVGISKGVTVVFSEELPDREAIIAKEERNKKSQVGTISYLPATFGILTAQAVLNHLIEKIDQKRLSTL